MTGVWGRDGGGGPQPAPSPRNGERAGVRGGGAWLDFGPSSDLAALGCLLPVPGRRGRAFSSAAFRPGGGGRRGAASLGAPRRVGWVEWKPGGRQAPPLRAQRLKDERKIPGRFQPLRASLVGPCLPSAASNRVVSPAFGGRRPWSTSSRLQTPLRGPEHGQGYRNFFCLSSVIPGGAQRREGDPGGLARGALRLAALDPLPAPAARRG
jgi:hypothetical protein